MLPSEREVAGLRCGEVLEELAEYLDGGLAAERRERLEAHVTECDVCRRFGGEYAGAVAALRRELGAEPEVPAEVRRRLRERLRAETGAP